MPLSVLLWCKIIYFLKSIHEGTDIGEAALQCNIGYGIVRVFKEVGSMAQPQGIQIN